MKQLMLPHIGCKFAVDEEVKALNMNLKLCDFKLRTPI
ncbi:hypothetical protein EV200_101154 [Pedobacter psychrotolerans]|uniref:Uncharacterized protein n=1 Tax=Pedobacter psychrotolerans TaxID=1843235 RepID=A0A4V2S093_9SPHI|nr:hypothetical protein EV200_101154 [Pedobacter psychrotolerans]